MVPAQNPICPKCGEWRRDVSIQRAIALLSRFLLIIPLIAFYIGKQRGWWFNITTEADRIIQRNFDWNVFITSSSGLAVTISFAILLVIAIAYYVIVSRKLDKWAWM